MLIRIAVAISDKTDEEQLVSKLIGLSIVLKDEFDIALYSDCFEKLCNKIDDVDVIISDFIILQKHKSLLESIYLKNPKCLPILVGASANEVKDYLIIRPAEYLSSVSEITPESEADKVKKICKLFMLIVNKGFEEKTDNNILYITTKQNSYAIPKDSILYCQSDLKYTVFVLKSGMLIRKLEKLQDVQEKYLWDFKRIHQSFLVNPKQVKGLDKVTNEIILFKDTRIPFSRKYSSEVRDLFKN